MQAILVLHPRVGVRRPARVVRGITVVVPCRPGQTREPQALDQAASSELGRRLFHTREVAAECGRRARDHDGCAIGHTRRIRTRRVRHDAAMRIADFALERYFARWEFAVDHLLCASDVQAYLMGELLALATTSRGPCGTT